MSKKATSSSNTIRTEINNKDACRVCMKKQIELSCIFGEGCDTIEKIEYCTGLMATKEDGLPSFICKNCTQDLATAYKFKSTCLLAYKIYRNLLKTELEIAIQYDDTAPTPDEQQGNDESDSFIDDNDSFIDDNDSFIDNNDFVTDEVIEEQHTEIKEPVNVEGNGTPNKTLQNDSRDSRGPYIKIKPRYWCELCKIDLKTKLKEKVHMKIIHMLNISQSSGRPIITVKPIHWCETCKIDLKNKLNKEEHMKSIHGLKNVHKIKEIVSKPIHWCETCKIDLKTKLKKEVHMKIIHKLNVTQGSSGPIITIKPIHWCETCKIDLKNKLNIEEHMKSIHGLKNVDKIKEIDSKPVHWCKTCKIDLKTKLKKEVHMKINHELKHVDTIKEIDSKPTHWCELCKIDLKTKLQKEVHMNIIHSNSKLRNVSGDSGDPLIEIKDSDTKPLHWCETCKIDLKTKLKKEVHMKIIHSNSKLRNVSRDSEGPLIEIKDIDSKPLHWCETCKIDLKTEFKKEVHMKIIHKVNNDPRRSRGPSNKIKKIGFKLTHWCGICKIDLKTKVKKDKHMKSVHNLEPEARRWICEVCGKIMAKKLEIRHRYIHLPPRFGCDQCEYKATFLCDLKKHKLVHAGIKQFQCQKCAALFRTSSGLSLHMRRIHDNNCPKRYKCEHCGKGFYERTRYRRHVDTHNKLKRFECEMCCSTFATRCFWKKHREKVHNIVTPRQRPGRQKTFEEEKNKIADT